MALVDELFIALGFKVDDKDVKKADNSLKSIIGTAGKVATAVVAATVALDRMANSLARNNQEFINFNRQTGLSLDKMQSIATAGMLVDYNFDPSTAMSSLQALESNLAQIRLGEGNIAPFQILGISPVGKDATQIIDDLREAIKGIDDMTAVNLIQQMGLSPQFISILRMSKEEMNGLNKELMLTPEERTALQQYSMELRKIHMEFALLKDRALIAIMPALNKFLDGLAAMAEVLLKIGKGLKEFWDGLGKAKLGIAGLALAILTYFNPVIATLTALYLILEDIAVWATGGKSFFGTTFDLMGEKFKELNNYIDEQTRVWGGLLKTLREITSIIFNPANTGQKHGEWLRSKFDDLIGNNFKTMGNLNNTNTVNQTNYFNSTGAMPENLAAQTADLAFAYMQIDRTA